MHLASLRCDVSCYQLFLKSADCKQISRPISSSHDCCDVSLDQWTTVWPLMTSCRDAIFRGSRADVRLRKTVTCE